MRSHLWVSILYVFFYDSNDYRTKSFLNNLITKLFKNGITANLTLFQSQESVYVVFLRFLHIWFSTWMNKLLTINYSILTNSCSHQLVKDMRTWILTLSTWHLLVKVNEGDARKMYKIWATVNNKGTHYWRFSRVFIVNFKQISHSVPVFPLLTLNKQMPSILNCSTGIFKISQKVDRKMF